MNKPRVPLYRNYRRGRVDYFLLIAWLLLTVFCLACVGSVGYGLYQLCNAVCK